MEYNYIPLFNNMLGSYIQEHKVIANKKCINNIHNDNNYCFIYCFLLHIYYDI